MDMITVKQAAEKWGVTPRRVQGLCKEGKIPGASRWERIWMIPADAVYPKADRSETQLKEKPIPRKSPSLMMTDLYHIPGTADEVIESLSDDPKTAAIFAAEIAYNRFEFDRVNEYAQILLNSKHEFHTAIAAGLQLAICAVYKGDMQLLIDARKHIFEASCENDSERDIVNFWLCVVDFILGDINMPEWFQKGRFDFVSADLYPAIKFQYAKFQWLYVRKMILSNDAGQKEEGKVLLAALPYLLEPMISQAVFDHTLLAEIGLRMVAAIIYHDLQKDEEAVYHLDKAIRLAVPDRLFAVFIEFRPMLDTLLDERLALISPEALNTVKNGVKKLKESHVKLFNDLKHVRMHSLSVRERQAAKLAVFGMSNAEIANRMHISENTVRSILSMAMNKTGAENRKELGQYL